MLESQTFLSYSTTSRGAKSEGFYCLNSCVNTHNTHSHHICLKKKIFFYLYNSGCQTWSISIRAACDWLFVFSLSSSLSGGRAADIPTVPSVCDAAAQSTHTHTHTQVIHVLSFDNMSVFQSRHLESRRSLDLSRVGPGIKDVWSSQRECGRSDRAAC